MTAMFSRRQVLISALGLPLLLLASPSYAFAASNEGVEDLSPELIARANPFVRLDETTFIFDASSAASALSAEEIDLVQDHISLANAQISETLGSIDHSNTVVYTSGKMVVIAESTVETPHVLRSTTYHEGVDKVEYGWFGVRIYISRSTLKTAVKTGATIGGIYVSSVMAKTALAMLGIASDYIPGGIVIESNIVEAVLLRIGKIYWQ
ncbi:hypothetical protein DW781_05575 [Olsenella sp. AM30-3LB]|uniref:hypothetical protein n=1 Tax=Olsenella sp. AM30-3LB TaxID=2292359 RepID=UPI000E525C6A|nr:hypothetical protein [Olsenella sp. AM30-3LB]RHD74853.1 hypothetical protein DW781_05575 [Olsenella sp. AM30-3LB]